MINPIVNEDEKIFSVTHEYAAMYPDEVSYYKNLGYVIQWMIG
jgi:hypothetical protein